MRKYVKIYVIAFLLLMGIFSVTTSASETDFRYNVVDGGVEITAYTGSDGNVIIPEKIGEAPVVAIGDLAFYVDDITSVVIPASVKIIGENAFASCKNLSSVSFTGDGLEKIGMRAFEGCESLMEFNFPLTVNSLEEGIFVNCKSLKNADMSKLTVIKFEKLFYNCKELTYISLPQNITKIPNNFCVGCDKLSTVIIGDKVITIGESAFSHCYGLTNINFPESVTTIEPYAFYQCKSLETITLSKYITSIGEQAFAGANLNTVYVDYDTYAYNYYKNKGGINLVVNGAPEEKETETKEETETKDRVSNSTKIRLNKTKATITAGFKLKLKLYGGSKIKWKSSNKKIATVSSKGVVKGKKKGKVTITATYKGKSYKCKVKVMANEITRKTIDSISSYPEAVVVFEPVKIVQKNNKYIVEYKAVNNSKYAVVKLIWGKFNLQANGKTFLSKKVGSKNLSIPAYSSRKMKVTFSGKDVKKKKVDLRNVEIDVKGTKGQVWKLY